nr:CopD family protein [Ardenticatena sp.]
MNAIWTLALSYAGHLLATIVWIGWSLLLSIAATTQEDALLQRARRWAPWAVLGFVVLGGSGFYQMVQDPHYEDLFAITNAWSRAMLIKHLLYGVELVLLLWLEMAFFPELRLQQRLRERGRPTPHYDAQLRRLRFIAWANLILAGGVLLATAYMTAIP